MKLEVVEARAKRSKLIELAGRDYRDSSSEIVAKLNRENQRAFLGIQHDNGPYTIIGSDRLFLSTPAGMEFSVSHSEFLNAMQSTGMDRGKGGEFEYVPVGEGHSVWVKDGPTMCALWNIVLALSRSLKNAES